jgi:hypothetical protein
MPFRPLAGALAFCGGTVRVEQVWARGESVGGDAVFAEEGRADGGLLLLLVDATSHGPRAQRLVRHL